MTPKPPPERLPTAVAPPRRPPSKRTEQVTLRSVDSAIDTPVVPPTRQAIKQSLSDLRLDTTDLPRQLAPRVIAPVSSATPTPRQRLTDAACAEYSFAASAPAPPGGGTEQLIAAMDWAQFRQGTINSIAELGQRISRVEESSRQISRQLRAGSQADLSEARDIGAMRQQIDNLEQEVNRLRDPPKEPDKPAKSADTPTPSKSPTIPPEMRQRAKAIGVAIGTASIVIGTAISIVWQSCGPMAAQPVRSIIPHAQGAELRAAPSTSTQPASSVR